MRDHRSEFPEIKIPQGIEQMVAWGLLIDTSWHNDAAASFEGYRGDTGIRLWVQDEDTCNRELGEPSPQDQRSRLGWRFIIGRLWMSGDVYQLTDPADPKESGVTLYHAENEVRACGWVCRWLWGISHLGQRVRFGPGVFDSYPRTTVQSGETGSVVAVSADCVSVLLDRHHPSLEEWGNQLHLSAETARANDMRLYEFIRCYLELP